MLIGAVNAQRLRLSVRRQSRVIVSPGGRRYVAKAVSGHRRVGATCLDGGGQTKAAAIRLKTQIVEDAQLGVEAFCFLMPADWKVEGGVVWRANPVRPATVSIRIYDPVGMEDRVGSLALVGPRELRGAD
jgi:hypothetical protein